MSSWSTQLRLNCPSLKEIHCFPDTDDGLAQAKRVLWDLSANFYIWALMGRPDPNLEYTQAQLRKMCIERVNPDGTIKGIVCTLTEADKQYGGPNNKAIRAIDQKNRESTTVACAKCGKQYITWLIRVWGEHEAGSCQECMDWYLQTRMQESKARDKQSKQQ